MLGAAGEQLAVYNGVQVKFDRDDNETERFVYMYLHSYISAGGQLVTLANGTKQFNIVDNLGSVRCIVSWDGASVSTQAFDYKPFGDLQNASEENRIGYFGEQRDKESDYLAMGFRLYDPEIGRFLAIDPLLDVQPSQTPYHYCFNNPTSFTDPTGLYPEKEKGDKVLDVVKDDWDLQRSIQMFLEDQAIGYELELLGHRWSADQFSAWCFGEFVRFKFSGGGHAFNVRLGENGSGSFTYYNSRNGVMCNVNFRYNKGEQNPVTVVGMLVGSLNWIANSNQSNYLKTFSNGNSINVDVSRTGEEIGKIYGYDFVAGISKSIWMFPCLSPLSIEGTYPNYSPEEDAKYEVNWIYIASKYMDPNYKNKFYKYDLLNESNELYSSDNYFNFGMIFSHEFKHRYDATYGVSGYPETSARLFTRDIMNYYGFNYYDFYLNREYKKLY